MAWLGCVGCASSRPAVRVDPEARAEPTAPAEPTAHVVPLLAAPPDDGMGILQINTRPSSTILVDGRVIGMTPQMAIRLSPGSHVVEMVNERFDSHDTVTVEIVAGQTTRRVITLTIPTHPWDPPR